MTDVFSEIITARDRAKLFPDMLGFLAECVSLAPDIGLILEFGVGAGTTTRAIAAAASRVVYAFDSFLGLPEQWTGPGDPPGAFGLGGQSPHFTETNIRVVKGWFEDTVPQFFVPSQDLVAFAHVDCDIYSSTKVVLDALAPHIMPGTILNFNEFWDYPGAKNHEAKAFAEFIETNGLSYECFGRCGSSFTQAAFRIFPVTK